MHEECRDYIVHKGALSEIDHPIYVFALKDTKTWRDAHDMAMNIYYLILSKNDSERVKSRMGPVTFVIAPSDLENGSQTRQGLGQLANESTLNFLAFAVAFCWKFQPAL